MCVTEKERERKRERETCSPEMAWAFMGKFILFWYCPCIKLFCRNAGGGGIYATLYKYKKLNRCKIKYGYDYIYIYIFICKIIYMHIPN